MKRTFLALVFCSSIVLAQDSTVFSVYYLPNPNFRPASPGYIYGGLPPWEIDWTGVTHIVCSINSDNVQSTTPYWTQMSGNDSLEQEFGSYSNPGSGPPYTHYLDSTIAIAHRLGIKVMTCVNALGGGAVFGTIAADSTKSNALARTIAQYCVRKGFDGVEFDIEQNKPGAADWARYARIQRRELTTYLGANAIMTTAAGIGDDDYYPVYQDSLWTYISMQAYGGSFWCGVHSRNENFCIPPLYKGYTHDPSNSFSLLESRTADHKLGLDAWLASGHAKSKLVIGQMAEIKSFPPLGSAPYGDTLLGNAGYYETWGNWVEAMGTLSKGGTLHWDNTRKGSWIGGTASSAISGYNIDIPSGSKFVIEILSLQAADTLAAYVKGNGYRGIMMYDVFHGRDPQSTNVFPFSARVPLMTELGTALGASPPTTSAPTVTTSTPIATGTTTGSGGGNVTDDGGASVTARGVCWSTSANPTTANSHSSDGTGTGSFTSSLTGLLAGTLYHVRAYATNSVGTSYGSYFTFTTGTPSTGRKVIITKTIH